MSERIVVILRKSVEAKRAHPDLEALPSSALVEPLFKLPPMRAGEHETVSEMRRTMRVTVPEHEIDVEDLVRKLKADPLVENAYRERPAEPA